MATLPSRASSITTFLVGIGLLCCVYLAALKLLNIPCPLTGCWEIINSRYGAVFGVPLPLLAIPCWVVLALPASRAWLGSVQLACAILLALGGLALMGIQFFVLKGFCPFCTLHAAAAIATAIVLPWRGRAHAWLPSLALALALPVFLGVKLLAEARVQSWDAPGYTAVPVIPKASREARGGRPTVIPSSSMISLQANIDEVAFSWLGPIDPDRSPILVVSFQCPHCLDLLGQTLKHPQFGSLYGPRVLLFSSPENSADSMALLAAILSAPGTPQEQFTKVFSQLGMLFDPLLTRDSKALRSRLGALFPRYTEKLGAAKELLDAQARALRYIPGHGTPFLLLPDGSGRYEATPGDILFR
ncbi:MAG TPA: vitamin K epoxide reductase family protein [Opitutaceae bacterium]|nr:vitamin K epoxide reductase family protein [Opitutaceae bacterium]